MTKSIYLSDELNYESVAKCIDSLIDFQEDNKVEEVVVYITSEGGLFYPSFALFDFISNYPKKIVTVALGVCMSTALMVLQAGKVRRSTKNTVFLMHLSSHETDSVDIKELNKRAEQFNKEHKKFVELIVNRSKVDEGFMSSLSSSYFFDPKKALEMGLVDEVI